MCEVGGEMEDRVGGRKMRLIEGERKTGFWLDACIRGWKEVQRLCILGNIASSVGVMYNFFSRVLGHLSIHSNFCTKV